MKIKVLIFVVAYNAEKTIASVISRIPKSLYKNFDTELLIIDDASEDKTKEIAEEYLRKGFWCPSIVLKNSVNQGYGGNQKIGYRYAIKNSFSLVILLHGDGQYAPEEIPNLLTPFLSNTPPDVVFGSRMINKRNAIKGGMPYYKLVGNRILTSIQNLLLNSNLTEFHSGYRVYSTKTLKKIPIELNTNDFHFDTEIIVQLFASNAKVLELPIPTHYGEEICHVNGLKYAFDVIKTSVKARLIKLGIFFDPRFQFDSNEKEKYVSKFNFFSTHSVAFEKIHKESVVLDLGCASGYFSKKILAEKKCLVYSVDFDKNNEIEGCNYQFCNLNESLPDIPWNKIDTIVMLDVIEHLISPEKFLCMLREKLSSNEKVNIIISTGNVCFFIPRIMMLFGQFNYGPRGILDITHTRLFTIGSFKRLLKYGGFNIKQQINIPGPYYLAINNQLLSNFLMGVNKFLIKIMPGLFSYQILLEVEPIPNTSFLLEQAINNSKQ